jgi:hypothetical protein
MPLENLPQRTNVPTLPVDPNDPARFSQLVEATKDAFQVEIQTFFNYKGPLFASRKREIPTIQKYEFGFQPSDRPVETFARILLQHPDVLEKMPLVAITSASGNTKSLGIGTQYVDAVQLPARIKSTVTTGGPFALAPGDKIGFRTTPDGKNPVISSVTFLPQFFQDITHATMQEIIACAAVQLLYVTAKQTSYSTPTPLLRFDAVGILAKTYPNSITVLGAPYSTPNALTALGFQVGQTNNSASFGPSNRYYIAADLTVGLDIGTEDENERREIMDLLHYFLVLEMDKRRKTFLGRSIFDDEFQQAPGQYENYQITLLDKHTFAGEAEIARQPGSGEQQDLIYVNRMSVPVTVIDYVDRNLQPPWGYPTKLTHATDDSGLPAGDHAGFGETSNP